MKKLIFFYLTSFNIINYISILLFGSDTEGVSSFMHPGILIKGFISVLLIFWYFNNKINLNSRYFKLGLPIILLLLLVYHPIQSYLYHSLSGLIFEYNQAFKITSFILIIFFVASHKEYFVSKFNVIMIINTLVVTLNLYLAYFFNFGRTTMYHSLGYYKGFLGGNATSVSLIILFAFLLYNFNKSKVYKVLFLINLFNFYILGTKSIYFIIPISILFLINDIQKNSSRLFTYSLLALSLGTVFLLSSLDGKVKDVYDDRLGYHYQHEYSKLLSKGRVYSNPILYVLETITSGPRLYNAVNVLNNVSQSDSWFILFGNGAKQQRTGSYSTSKMDPVDILYKYGLVGLLLIYAVVFTALKDILINRKSDLISTVIVCIAIYSSLGGFVIGTGDIGIFFGLFLGINYPIRKIII